MSGFDKDWLTLREPADLRARDPQLLATAIGAIERAAHPCVLDIGCGTGSTYRALRAGLTTDVRWRLLDHDEGLLAEAESRHGGRSLSFIRGDLDDLSSLSINGLAIVTASAFFDLCSADFIHRFVRHLEANGVGLYAALNYDGEMDWVVGHPLDDRVRDAFNRHQKTDKGFGPAAGPDAWASLAAELEVRGFRVQTAASPWILSGSDAPLQRLFLKGVVDAVSETGIIAAAPLEDWHRFRLDAIDRQGSSCRVGHQDVFGIP